MLNHVPDQAEGLRRLIDSAQTVEPVETIETPETGETATLPQTEETAETGVQSELIEVDPSEFSDASVDEALDEHPVEEDVEGEPAETDAEMVEPKQLSLPPEPEPSAILTVPSRQPARLAPPLGRDRLGIRSETKVIAVTSGKGGVGKTNLVCNAALALSQMGRRVAVFDADLSLANIDVLLGISPRYNLSHVISGEKTLKEVVVSGPEGILIVPGGSGIEELANLNSEGLEHLLDSFETLDGECDVLLIDTAAGISQTVISFLLAADHVVVVTTPEPTAYTDAYAVIKILAQRAPEKSVAVAVNMARNSREAGDVVRLMLQICRTMLHTSFDNLGSIPRDLELLQAVRDQRPLLLHSPYSPAAKSIRRLACSLLQTERQMQSSGGLRGFMSRLLGRVSPHVSAAVL